MRQNSSDQNGAGLPGIQTKPPSRAMRMLSISSASSPCCCSSMPMPCGGAGPRWDAGEASSADASQEDVSGEDSSGEDGCGEGELGDRSNTLHSGVPARVLDPQPEFPPYHVASRSGQLARLFPRVEGQ